MHCLASRKLVIYLSKFRLVLRCSFTSITSKSQIGMDNKDKIENMEKESLPPIPILLLLWLLHGHPGKIPVLVAVHQA